MAITHSTSTRNNLADQVDSDVNSGTTDAQGDFVLIGTGTTVLASITLQSPAFDSATGGSITLQGVPLTDTSANNSGTASSFEVQDKDNNVVFSGSVASTGSPDLTIDNDDINSGQSVKIDSLVYSAPQ